MKGRIDLNRFVALSATNHARTYGLYPRKGTIAVGSDADIALWDPARRVHLTHALLQDGSDYTPYEGMDITGWPVMTIVRGRVVMREGRLIAPRAMASIWPARSPRPEPHRLTPVALLHETDGRVLTQIDVGRDEIAAVLEEAGRDEGAAARAGEAQLDRLARRERRLEARDRAAAMGGQNLEIRQDDLAAIGDRDLSRGLGPGRARLGFRRDVPSSHAKAANRKRQSQTPKG